MASSQPRRIRLHTPPSSGYRAAPGNTRPHFGQRDAGEGGLRCESGWYPTYSVPGKVLPSWSFSTNTGNRPSLNCWCFAHLMPVCRSMYMSVQTTRMNRRREPRLLISAPCLPQRCPAPRGLATAFPRSWCARCLAFDTSAAIAPFGYLGQDRRTVAISHDTKTNDLCGDD